MARILKNSLLRGVVTRPLDKICRSARPYLLTKDFEKNGAALKEMIRQKFNRSFHIREVDTGSCGGCESEIIATTNPIYDIQRFGIDFVASPRHADALLVTGPVSKNMRLALQKTYEAMPRPKLVIALGNCAIDGGVFKGSYYVEEGVDKVLPVYMHIPGCPPSPADIITALLDVVKSL